MVELNLIGFEIYLLFSLCATCSRTDFGTYLGVSIKLPLDAVFNFTNGPPPVEKTGVDEFPFLEKTHIETKRSTNKKLQMMATERNYRIPYTKMNILM